MRDFEWENKLSVIGMNDQVAMKIMSNFIPNETMIFDDRDPP